MSAITELELETELASEGEGEFEFAGELEQELGLAHELVQEFELEHEQEAEHEAFFNNLAAMADRSGRSQSLRRIALAAARSALKSQAGTWPIVDGEGELGELEGELGELEGLQEFEFEASPTQLTHFLASMEHEGHAAAEAANEQEAAEHFLPLIGLAAKFVLPKLAGMAAKKLGGKLIGKAGGQLLRRFAPRLIRRVAPQLTRGLANVTRTLFRNRTTRPLLHAVPRIARTTVARLGRQIAGGQRITPQLAARTLAQQTARTLSNPGVLAQTYQRSLALDRQYHRRKRRVLGSPAGAPVRAANDPGAWPGGGVPGITPSAAGWPPPSAGGCGCNCQPAGIMPPPVVPVCPTCGR
ncbi:MAG: hypothetical protein ACKV2U_04815 [Bryobacteraceae bacterium]